jgi:hypothetical protein
MPGVTREQIARAKEIGIEEYILRNEANNVRRIGNAYYLKDHESLEISSGLWNWHSRGIGGRNVIDYLVKVRGYDFVDAVRHLAGEAYSGPAAALKARPPGAAKQPERKPFKLPPRNADNKRVIAYLEQRGIDKALTQECIDRGLLYESAHWHNCVFVGRDDNGKARFAALRGTTGDFKRDADGSDKRFGFALPPTDRDCKTVIVFESPTDAISHKALCPDTDGRRLSLGGTALAALTCFLERRPETESIIVCTDSDAAGNAAAQKIAGFTDRRVTRLLPPAGKDWNEALQSGRNEVKELKDVRKDIRFIDSDYRTLFIVKDGDNIKITRFDGEELIKSCRFIDETHTQIGSEIYHICEFAERMEQNGNKYEPIPGQEPKLHVLAGKYGERLQDCRISMTDEAIGKSVGGDYDTETLYNHDKKYVCGALVRGKDGIAICGLGGDNNDILTCLHPYHAQTYKREMGTVERPAPEVPVKTAKKPSLLGNLEKSKEEVAETNAAGRAGRERSRDAPDL